MRSSDGLHPPRHPGVLAGFARRPRPRHRARRSRAGVAAVLLAVGLAPMLAGRGGLPAFAAIDQPTVTFLGGGPAPLACSSTPSPPNMTVKQSTRVVLANFTGVDATADIGDGRTVVVAEGKAISVKLKEGVYTITMTPDCLETYNIGAAVITVVDDGPSPSPAPPPASPPTRTDAPPEGAAGPVAGGAGSAEGSYPSSPVAGPLGGGSGPAGGALPGPAGPGASEPEVEEATAVPPGNSSDRRGDRLLAVIAAICVFGVTTAIIRAIVAQRATRAVGA
jgi:hypothetical protein